MKVPSKNGITLNFGATSAPYSPSNPHKGTDFGYLPNDMIFAPFAGKVTLVPNNGNDGNGIYMTDTQGRFHGLLHTNQYLVSNGQQVNEGQPVGIMGSTGLAQGRHLHWAVKENGKFIDPMSIIKEEKDMAYPNKGDLTNIYNLTGWSGHPPNDNDVAYWCNGTGNPHWGNPNDVWSALTVEVSNWTKANAQPVKPTSLTPGIYEVK